MIRQEVENISINGYSGLTDEIKAMFDEFQDSIQRMRRIISVGETDHENWWHEGRRFTDDQSVFLRLGSALCCSDIRSFSPEEKDYLAMKALKVCAEADYWYTFEKDWGYE